MSKSPLLGMAIFAGGMFMFSAVDTLAKLLTESFHPVQVAWSRQVALCLGILTILVLRGPGILKTRHLFLQVSRGALAAMSATIFIVAIQFVPLADAVAISFVAPFMVTILAALILGERVGLRRWIAVTIGFLATLIVIRPGLGVLHPAAGLVLVAAFFYAMRQILSRRLSGSDPTITTVAYTGLTASACLSIPVLFVWRTPATGNEWAMLIGMSGIAACAEILVIRGLELTEAVVLAPLHYTLLIWGTMYGWLVFHQLPDIWTWVGALVIMATGLYTVHRERLAVQRKTLDASHG